jgi:hypothetical protein
MKKFYSISIPEPCHENWNTMIPEEKGRFCNSCSKTVIDFTTMDTLEVQDFINHNKQNNICGHFKQTQLNNINLYIPSHVLIQKQGFNRMFLWTLLIVMGTSLMNCTNKSGNKQKIDSIEIVDSISSKTIKTFEASQKTKKNDSLKTKTCSTPVKDTEITEDGLLIIETLGEVEFIEAEATEIDSIIIPEKIEPVDLIGIPVYQEEEEEILVGLLTVETPPEFKNTPKHLKLKEKRDYFSEEITRIFLKNFNTSICTELTGKQKIFTQFKINKDGLISDIKIRAPHPDLEKETKRVLKLFPKFIPATQANQPVAIIYNLPIVFTRQD